MKDERTSRGESRATWQAKVDVAVEDVRARLLVGADPGALHELPARVRRALEVSRSVGGSALGALDAAMAAVQDERRLVRAVRVASSEARAVILGLVLLPVAALAGLGALLDQPLWRFYLDGAGPLVAAAGAGLAAVGVLVAHSLVRRVARPPRHPARPGVALVVLAATGAALAGPAGAAAAAAAVAAWHWRRALRPAPPARGVDEIADLLAVTAAAGLSGAAGMRVVADVAPAHAAELRQVALGLEISPSGVASLTSLTAGLDRIAATIAAAQRHGAPVADALTRLARDLRAAELARALAAAERLPALLTFPTALCLLPASILLVGAPLVAYGLSAAGGGSGP